ncbi:MAG TPA: winged helix-turn-helix domain-containing protein [Terracidiphilus sp.]|jgi:DNA-binding winged helix-turn-helix (wHTH) protein/TolB-like protein
MIRFGVFEFNFSTSELRRNGILVRLQAQPAKVLSHLLSHTNRVVSREELHDAIWGNSTFVDFERGLNVCIAQIRAALGDESTAPRYIRTIPRQGYEFICPVQRLTAPPSPACVESVPLQRSPRWLLVSFVALLLIATAVAGYLIAHSRSHAIAPLVVAVARFDNETGDAAVTSFADALTDDVVAQLTDTSDSRLHIIGNAPVLRLPRQQRDLLQISNSLHAQFIVLGQVQRIGTQTRILAHLIRMPEQSHVWVVRLDQPFNNPSALESAASREISIQFASKLTNPAALTALPGNASR